MCTYVCIRIYVCVHMCAHVHCMQLVDVVDTLAGTKLQSFTTICSKLIAASEQAHRSMDGDLSNKNVFVCVVCPCSKNFKTLIFVSLVLDPKNVNSSAISI